MFEMGNSKVFLIQISGLNTFTFFLSGKDRLRLIKFQLWSGGRGARNDYPFRPKRLAV